MTNKILDAFSASAALTITLASLASSTVGVGRQSTMVDNTTTKEQMIRLFVKLTQGTTITGSRSAYLYLLTGDNNASVHRTDGAGASDAAITIQNAPIVGVLRNKAAPTNGDILYGEFLIRIAAPSWGIAVVHDTVAALDSTGSNHYVRYNYVSPDVQ